MHGKARTKAQQRRIDILKREVGCLACLRHGEFREADYHHAMPRNAKVAYHDWGYPLCPWHHRGIGYGLEPTRIQTRKFRERYGTEEELVAEANERLKQFESSVV